jgi:hypothetical protein
MHPFSVFGVGVIGAAAPEILWLYTIREDPSKFRWSRYFIVISLVFEALGGFVALLFRPSSCYSAFYTGLAFPFIVNSLSERALNKLTHQVKGASAVGRGRGRFSPLQSFIKGL